jgi:hypothetical protein
MQHTMLERFQTGKQLEPVLERWWHAGWVRMPTNFGTGERRAPNFSSLDISWL